MDKGVRKVVPNYLLEDFGSSSTSVNSSATTSGGVNAGDNSDSPTPVTTVQLPRRKKKLRQACIYCRRSHLVCEEKRPCARCVKRGIADRCADSQAEEASDLKQNGDPPSLSPTPPRPLSNQTDPDTKRRRTIDPVEAAPTSSPLPQPAPLYPTAAPELPHYAPLPHRRPSTNVLQEQPIFQPPSSAELDSLFSSYFFDVADAFSVNPRFPPHIQPMQTPALAPDAHLLPSQVQAPSRQYQMSATSAVPSEEIASLSSLQRASVTSTFASEATQQRQIPGDVYAPYPYRKGYASLMRYMTEQNWSEKSIRSVEAALSKIRQLWFSLEDNIQPSSMIQLQAEWAGNVRYFSESVLPFTPVPMVVCRKAGEVYGCNQLALDLCRRSREEMTLGNLSCYEFMTEESASCFFRLYERAMGGAEQQGDGQFFPTVGLTHPLYWNADLVVQDAAGKSIIVPTRGIFEMKIAPCGLPSLLVVCFVPLN